MTVTKPSFAGSGSGSHGFCVYNRDLRLHKTSATMIACGFLTQSVAVRVSRGYASSDGWPRVYMTFASGLWQRRFLLLWTGRVCCCRKKEDELGKWQLRKFRRRAKLTFHRFYCITDALSFDMSMYSIEASRVKIIYPQAMRRGSSNDMHTSNKQVMGSGPAPGEGHESPPLLGRLIEEFVSNMPRIMNSGPAPGDGHKIPLPLGRLSDIMDSGPASGEGHKIPPPLGQMPQIMDSGPAPGEGHKISPTLARLIDESGSKKSQIINPGSSPRGAGDEFAPSLEQIMNSGPSPRGAGNEFQLPLARLIDGSVSKMSQILNSGPSPRGDGHEFPPPGLLID